MNLLFRLRVAARVRHPWLAAMALLWSTAIGVITEEPIVWWAARLTAMPWIYLQLPGAAWVRGLIFPAACGLQLLRFPPSGAAERAAFLFLYAAYAGILLQPPPHASTVQVSTAPLEGNAVRHPSWIPWAFAVWAAGLAAMGALSASPAVGLLFSGVFGLAHFPHWLAMARFRRGHGAVIAAGTFLYVLVWSQSLRGGSFIPGLWVGLSVWAAGVGKVAGKPEKR